LNVLIVESRTHNVIHKKSYDTGWSYDKPGDRTKKASKQIIKDYKKVPAGSIIMIAVMEDAKTHLSKGVKQILASMGS